jgi:hypothetical protein
MTVEPTCFDAEGSRANMIRRIRMEELRQLGLFEAEIRFILEGQRPSRVHVLYFDTEVHENRTGR